MPARPPAIVTPPPIDRGGGDVRRRGAGPRLAALVLAAAVAAALSPRAARAAPEHDVQQWLQVLVDGDLDAWARGLRLSLDLQLRRMNAPLLYERDPETGEIVGSRQNPNTLVILRPAAGYAFAPWISGWIGYAWTPNYFDDPSVRAVRDIGEHRLWEQLALGARVATVELSSRTRIEQRYRTRGPGSPTNADGLPSWAVRVRQQLRVSWAPVPAAPWRLVFSDELFFHLNRTHYPSAPGLDQNRSFLGVGHAGKMIRVELGYLLQYVRRFTDPHQVNHAVVVNVVIPLGGGPRTGGPEASSPRR